MLVWTEILTDLMRYDAENERDLVVVVYRSASVFDLRVAVVAHRDSGTEDRTSRPS